MSIDAPCHCSCSGGHVEKKCDTCRRFGKRCFSGKEQHPFIPQMVESKTHLGSLLSAHATPSFPRATPLVHLRSAVSMSWISSTKLLSTSCWISDLATAGLVFALDQLFWQSEDQEVLLYLPKSVKVFAHARLRHFRILSTNSIDTKLKYHIVYLQNTFFQVDLFKEFTGTSFRTCKSGVRYHG